MDIFIVVFFMFIALAALVVAAKTIKIVPQATVMLIERLGRFSRVAGSGLNVIVPFLDKPRGVYWTNVRPGLVSIDLREQYIDLPPQPVITRDNVTIHVDSVVYWQITDPVKAVYEVTDLIGAIVQLTITGMRAVIGDMDLDHTLSQRDQINAKLRIGLDEATDKWGVKVTRVLVATNRPGGSSCAATAPLVWSLVVRPFPSLRSVNVLPEAVTRMSPSRSASCALGKRAVRPPESVS